MSKTKWNVAFSLMSAMFMPLMSYADAQGQNQMNYTPGERVKAGELPGGYNASASYRCLYGWDIFVTANYIYWDWQQESFQLGVLEPGAAGEHKAVFQDPGYASGFQVGLGFNMPGMDDWNLCSEYTWYKNSDTKSVTATSSVPLVIPVYHDEDALCVDGTVTSEVKMDFDALDFLVKRPFYFGKKLVANFSFGLKSLWITQHFNRTLNGVNVCNNDETLQGESFLKQTSWALGPKFGLETSWLLGYGIQIMGNVSTSTLYTRYNVNASSSTVEGYSTFVFLDNYNALKPVTEMFLGLGWNTGFCNNNYRIALTAGYDFDIYWNYNMKDFAVQNQKVVGDMFLQGLNIGARFDF